MYQEIGMCCIYEIELLEVVVGGRNSNALLFSMKGCNRCLILVIIRALLMASHSLR